MGKIKKANVYHIISAALIALSLLLAFFRFSGVIFRMGQAFEDFCTSIGFAFSNLYGVGDVVPTFPTIPEGAIEILPFDPVVFQVQVDFYFKTLFSWDNLGEYGLWLLDLVYIVLLALSIILPIFGCLLLLMYGIYGLRVNNNYGQDTKLLALYKRIEALTWDKVKYYVKDFIRFFKGRKLYKFLILAIWLYNLNVITMALEFVACWYYLSASLEWLNAYVFLAKFAMDLTVSLDFLPWWAWVIIGWVIFDKIRRKIGFKSLESKEKKNRAFLENHPGALFVTGKQRAKKTTAITDMALSQEVIFREKAKEKITEQKRRFPFFPWIHLENVIKTARKNHAIYTLATCREFVKGLGYHYKYSHWYKQEAKDWVLYRYKERYGYNYADFLFGYDEKRYGNVYNDGIYITHIFEAIELYAQLYFIYSLPTSLCISNYAIRTDFEWKDKGNWAEFKVDFFKKTAWESMRDTKMSKILNWNRLRLGKVDDPNDPTVDGFEFGINNVMEIAKERGNQHTNVGMSAKDDEVNVKNDLFEMDVKMRGHAATVANYTFVRYLFDDQRPDSLSADNKDLCDIIRIKKTSDPKIVMPGFAFEELGFHLWTMLYVKLLYMVRVARGDNTLFLYLLDKLDSLIFNHYTRVFNQYSVYTAQTKVWDGMDDEVLEDKGKYYIATAKVYRYRFATAAIRDYYHVKALRARGGINDFETWCGVNPRLSEYNKSGSLFFRKMRTVTGRRPISVKKK
ncbi:MAG: hypothetical protein IJ308_03620 [Clostridia bacterium]|nr:hypothetical protein [Clostridia bacterium]